ncbi:vacuolar membrane-associated protein IML1 [Histoplasma capsulatum var. duboisii H88]|uniref:Vacuolar membrane-associated protein IML1 n=2 Tax=Ajellomyces capsulatus (strain H88) TaxID=544711 RepID=F0UN43_AJEC8|nr:vacuolar membrane-associated protein IML1 [Histoplasma capsulatum var. duboisii H88]
MLPHGPVKGSHLRQVSTPSMGTAAEATNLHEDHADGISKTSAPESPAGPNSRPCSLWVHDDNFSREDVLFNISAFGDIGLKVGDLVELSTPRVSQGELHGSSNRLDPSGRTLRDAGDSDQSSNSAAKRVGGHKSQSSSTYGRYLFLVKPLAADIKARHPNLQISITSNIANIFGFKNHSQALISLKNRQKSTASHVELTFRDQFLVRSDMWRLAISELADKPVYKGQKITFMGTIKATVKSIYIDGKKALSGYFSPRTIPIFRSESARYVLFIQMSKEMWDFDSEGTGDILFSRVINSLLPELFKRWAAIDAHHLVSIVLFTRVQYDLLAVDNPGSSFLNNNNLHRTTRDSRPESQDFYRVVVNDMPSGKWTTILDELKKEFRIFLRDVSIPPSHFPDSQTSAEDSLPEDPKHPPTISGRPTSALRGNILEAINIASSYLAFEHIGRDLIRTGTSIVVISPGTGVFEVSYEALALTSEVLTSRTIGIDLICLSPMPLHSVPLFKYRLPSEPTSRPGSSISRDSIFRPSPSDSHLSGGSFSSKVSRPRSSNATLGPSSQAATVADNWRYGIPQWIDISYWNPKIYRDSRTAVNKITKSTLPATTKKQVNTFIPRVRMYEIQMMGVMESEQSNICVPYLSSADIRLQKLSDLYPSPHGSPYKPPLTETGAGSLMSTFKDSRRNILSIPATQRKMLEWMDSYDHVIFHTAPKERMTRRPSKAKRVDFETPGTRFYEQQSIRFSTSSVTHSGNYSTSPNNNHQRSDDGRSHYQKAYPPERVPFKKSSMKKASKSTKPRISRSISFALRGLGPTPPRATASTEINNEHAKGLSTTNKKPAKVGELPPNFSMNSPISDAVSNPTFKSPDPPQLSFTPSSDNANATPSKPISIRIANKKAKDEHNMDPKDIDSSFSTTSTEVHFDRRAGEEIHGPFPMTRTGRRFDLAFTASQDEPTMDFSPTKVLSPWILPVNPCKPSKRRSTRSSWFGRWQHVYPRMPSTASVKWKSLKSPASLPLTTEEFPTSEELASQYYQTPYRVYQNDESDVAETPRTREALLREMVALRLAHGFQIVVGRLADAASSQHSLGSLNIFNTRSLSKDGMTIFMSMGNIIHKLVCVAGGEIEVTKFTRKTVTDLFSDAKAFALNYTPVVKTILSANYCKHTINLQMPREDYNWNYADAFLAGYRDHLVNFSEQLRFWRTRFVLIPVQILANARRPMQSYKEDNEEEIHLLGITQLTQIWQRYRYDPPEEKRLQAPTHKKDQNPLDIIYQTSNPSEVVAAELDRLLLDDPGLDNPSLQLLPESELLQRSNISLIALAQAIQGEKGVRMMDRRWHWRLHYNCFVGVELTTWMLQNFRDIDTREEAVEFGNELMKHGLICHVQRRHNFRDGNYFYQITDEYRVARPESRSGWFQTRKSIPNTPINEGVKDVSQTAQAKTINGTADPDSRANTPTPGKSPRTKASVCLSKSMKIDVDTRKRSNRPEIIELHYDRLHNPDNCFHIKLSWMNATPKLVEDAIVSWAATAEKFGLKLVELPISEASSIVETQVFRRPYPVKLAIEPPESPTPTIYSATSFASQGVSDRQFYHKAILKKFDFVLDFEATDAFPPDVDVSYSWGRLDYRFPQYVHQTGAVLAQISDDGCFLLLANRLYSARGPSVKESNRLDRSEFYRPRAATYDALDRAGSPHLSPIVRASLDNSPGHVPQTELPSSYRITREIGEELKAFCSDVEQLEKFFEEAAVHLKPTSSKVSPSVPSAMDASIPTLELPASLVGRHVSPPPIMETPEADAGTMDVRMHGSVSPKTKAVKSPHL